MSHPIGNVIKSTRHTLSVGHDLLAKCHSLRGAHPSTNTSMRFGKHGNFMEDKYQGEPLPQPLDNNLGEK